MAVGDDNKQMAENGFTLHDRATSGSRIGRVKQILSSNELINELDLEVGVLPGLPFKIKGTVVTTASLQIVSDQKMELRLQGTKVKGSNIPLLNQLMEEELNMEIPVGEVYRTIRGDVPVIAMQVTFYVDESMRITQDVCNKTTLIRLKLGFGALSIWG
ncbi:unnamed protein product [Cylindrotheca closterium]|uniref:Uncharacterized protein n=1 Tax=Cylindrotheca closterium TaxID=2856 RepID=A0AAD2CDC2_9STRA|nr:unnamed protein product [Cylindrotheca closterium]